MAKGTRANQKSNAKEYAIAGTVMTALVVGAASSIYWLGQHPTRSVPSNEEIEAKIREKLEELELDESIREKLSEWMEINWPDGPPRPEWWPFPNWPPGSGEFTWPEDPPWADLPWPFQNEPPWSKWPWPPTDPLGGNLPSLEGMELNATEMGTMDYNAVDFSTMELNMLDFGAMDFGAPEVAEKSCKHGDPIIMVVVISLAVLLCVAAALYATKNSGSSVGQPLRPSEGKGSETDELGSKNKPNPRATI